MTEIPARLSVVTGARDMGVLRSFYRALGWPELPSGDETWTGFLLGGVLLALFPLRDLTAEAAPGSGNPTGWAGATLACAVDARDGVDGAFAAAVSAGATPVAAASDRSWGGRSAFIADPEGNAGRLPGGPGAPSMRAAPCPPGVERDQRPSPASRSSRRGYRDGPVRPSRPCYGGWSQAVGFAAPLGVAVWPLLV